MFILSPMYEFLRPANQSSVGKTNGLVIKDPHLTMQLLQQTATNSTLSLHPLNNQSATVTGHVLRHTQKQQ